MRVLLVVGLVALGLMSATCSSGGGGNPTAVIPATATETATVSPPTATPTIVLTPTPAPPCGQGASIELTSASPVGQMFHADDALTISFTYVAPGCVNAAATIFGFSVKGSPNYNYWCVDRLSIVPRQECAYGHFEAAMQTAQVRMVGATGLVTLHAVPGPFPPSRSDPVLAIPPMEGFEPCAVRIVLDDGHFGGPAFVQEIGTAVSGAPCSTFGQ